MEILQFKTNLNCNNCVQKASQEIDKISFIKNWEVETSNANKTMTVRGTQLESAEIVKAAKKAGFKVELMA